MCPVCMASAGFAISNVLSGGGIAALAVKIFRRKKGSIGKPSKGKFLEEEYLCR